MKKKRYKLFTIEKNLLIGSLSFTNRKLTTTLSLNNFSNFDEKIKMKNYKKNKIISTHNKILNFCIKHDGEISIYPCVGGNTAASDVFTDALLLLIEN